MGAQARADGRIDKIWPSLAAAVADDDFAAAFEPLTRALDAAHAAWPIFDQLLKKARA